MQLNLLRIFSKKTTAMKTILRILSHSKTPPVISLQLHLIIVTNFIIRTLTFLNLLVYLTPALVKPQAQTTYHTYFSRNSHLSELKLLQIYNLIWTQGVFPDQWHNENIISIPKPCKSKFEVENYRTISLINTCGFRRNHSTLDTLATIHTDICSAFNFNSIRYKESKGYGLERKGLNNTSKLGY